MSKDRVYPSFRYHKDLGEKIIHNEAQHEHLDKQGWKDSPAAFEEKKKPAEPVSDLDKELAALADSESENGEQPLEDNDEEEQPLEEQQGGAPEFTVEELRTLLLDSGRSKKEIKGKSIDELKAMLAE